MRRALCAALFFLVCFNPALGEVRIEASTGGVVSDYLALFAVLRQSGERIVIWSVLFGLHACLEHDPTQSSLRHSTGDPGFSCAEGGRRLWSGIFRSASNSRDDCRLSHADPQLDQPARRSDTKADLFARTRAHGPVSALPIVDVTTNTPIRAAPTTAARLQQ